MTSPEKKWLFLTQSNQQILNKNLLYGTLLSNRDDQYILHLLFDAHLHEY